MNRVAWVELKTLRRIVQEVGAASDLSEALRVLVERVKETLHADACSIFLSDEEQGEYVLMATDAKYEIIVVDPKIFNSRSLEINFLLYNNKRSSNQKNIPESSLKNMLRKYNTSAYMQLTQWFLRHLGRWQRQQYSKPISVRS